MNFVYILKIAFVLMTVVMVASNDKLKGTHWLRIGKRLYLFDKNEHLFESMVLLNIIKK